MAPPPHIISGGSGDSGDGDFESTKPRDYL